MSRMRRKFLDELKTEHSEMSNLPKIEVYFYFFLWAGGVFISLYHLFLVGQVFDHRDHDQYHYEDFKNGWKFLNGRFQDQADSEWNTWTSLVIKLTPFLCVNLLGAEILRFWRAFKYLPLWYITITISFLICHFSPFLIAWLLIQTLTYCLFIYIKSYVLLWLSSYIVVHYLRLEYWIVDKEDDQYVIMVSSSWLVLRCISYTSDKLKEAAPGKKKNTLKAFDILVFLAYSFYLPTMFLGPFISFDYFLEGIQVKNSQWTCSRLLKIGLKFLRCIFWFCFTLFALHFIYVNAILLRPNFVKHLLDWELAGLGIAMGHFFHLKYIVFYGIPCAWAAAEGYKTPQLPCCVSRVHLYSYMWRKFDQGLYQFLIRYIYIPVVSKLKGRDFTRKIVASVLCFVFVFAWHGQHDYVFFWVLFNFIAISIELAVKEICAMTSAQTFLQQNLSPQNKLRLQCFLAAPLHCFSMIANYFFIGNGVEIGFIYFRRVIHGAEFFLTRHPSVPSIILSYMIMKPERWNRLILTFHSGELKAEEAPFIRVPLLFELKGSVQSKLLVLLFLYGAGQSAVATQKWEEKKSLK